METDKVKLNEQIVLLRRFVRVAKVHIVRRLFRQMKMWRDKKGKTEQSTEKNKRKAERLKQEISIITKVDADVISKMALKEEKDWEAIIHQKDVTTEQRSFARLVNHKKIQEKVTQFRDANPDWQSWLPSTLQRWEKRKQAKTERMKSAPLEDKSTTNSETGKNSVSRSSDSTDETKYDEKKAAKKLENLEHINKTNLSQDSGIKENKKEKSKKKKGKPDKQKQINTEAEYKNAISKFLTKPKSDVVEKVEGSMEIAEINLDKLEDQETLPVHKITPVGMNTSADYVPKPEEKLKDAFFLGEDGGESDQESCSESEQCPSSEDEKSSHKPKSQFISSLSRNRGNDFSQLHKRKHPKLFPKQDHHPRKIFSQRERRGAKMQSDKIPNRNMGKISHMIDTSKVENKGSAQDSKLHPSWEAKRKMKQTAVLPFQGKKIRFDVND